MSTKKKQSGSTISCKQNSAQKTSRLELDRFTCANLLRSRGKGCLRRHS